MIVIEASGPALISIWFAFGALISLIVSVIPGAPWWSELIIFIVISISTLLALRPIFKKYLKRNTVRTNIDSFIGKKGYVIEDISFLLLLFFSYCFFFISFGFFLKCHCLFNFFII